MQQSVIIKQYSFQNWYLWLHFQRASWACRLEFLCATTGSLAKQRLPPKLFSTFNTRNLKQNVLVGHASTCQKNFLHNEMNPHKFGVRHYGRERQNRRRFFLVVFFRQEAEDEFTHAQEVHHLGDAKERRNDQGSTVGSLQEGWWTLITQDFPREEREAH